MKIIVNINILSWVLGVAFYYMGLNYLITFDFINFFLISLIAIVTFPPSFDILKKQIYNHFNFKLNNNYRLFFMIVLFIVFNVVNSEQSKKTTNLPEKSNYILSETNDKIHEEETAYKVLRIIDGDTIKVKLGDKIETIRLIGIDSPESVHPEKAVQCFAKEASNKLKELLSDKFVYLKSDKSQDNRDKYNRLLRYVYRTDYLFINKWLIENGFAYEYSYKTPYQFQDAFILAQKNAQENKLGLWEDGVCDDFLLKDANKKDNCPIKGNISFNSQEKIFHTPDCPDYDKTIINESNGEKWFCSEKDAISSGWSKAKNCPQ